MPLPESRPDPPRAELIVAVVLGGTGVVLAVAAADRPGLRILVAVAWLGAIALFGASCTGRSIRSWPASRNAGGPRGPGPASSLGAPAKAVALAVAAGSTVGATASWVFVPIGLAGWVCAASFLGVPWRSLLTAAVGGLAASAAAAGFGASSLADQLAVLSYALAWIACGTAVASGRARRRGAPGTAPAASSRR